MIYCNTEAVKEILEIYKKCNLTGEKSLSDFLLKCNQCEFMWVKKSPASERKSFLRYLTEDKVSTFFKIKNYFRIKKVKKIVNYMKDEYSDSMDIIINKFLKPVRNSKNQIVDIEWSRLIYYDSFVNRDLENYLKNNYQKIDIMIENIQKIIKISPVFYFNLEEGLVNKTYDTKVLSDGDINYVWENCIAKKSVFSAEVTKAHYVITDKEIFNFIENKYQDEFIIYLNSLTFDSSSFPNDKKDLKEQIENKFPKETFDKISNEVSNLEYQLREIINTKSELETLKETLNEEQVAEYVIYQNKLMEILTENLEDNKKELLEQIPLSPEKLEKILKK